MILEIGDIAYLIAWAENKKLGLEVEVLPEELDLIIETNAIDLAEFAEVKAPDGFMSCGPEAPGYLKFASDHWSLFVPWNLAERIPDTNILFDALELGISLSVEPADTVCISGSFVMTGKPFEVGDLDFSQYANAKPGTISKSIAALKEPDSTRVMTDLRYGMGDRYFCKIPWRHFEVINERIGSCSTTKELERIMANFIARSDFGVLPASNVVLPTEFDERSFVAISSSFVFQEVIAVRKGITGIPWRLTGSTDLALYLSFLVNQISEYRERFPIKALKRALSLSLMLSLDEFASRAVDILASEQASAHIKARRRIETDAALILAEEAGVDCSAYRQLISDEQSDADLPRIALGSFFADLETRVAPILLAEASE